MVTDPILLDIISKLDENDSEVLTYNSLDNAFGIGYAAASETAEVNCPYEDGSPEHDSWWHGYSFAKDETTVPTILH